MNIVLDTQPTLWWFRCINPSARRDQRFLHALALEVPAYTDPLAHAVAVQADLQGSVKFDRVPEHAVAAIPPAYRNRVLTFADLCNLTRN